MEETATEHKTKTEVAEDAVMGLAEGIADIRSEVNCPEASGRSL